MRRRRPLRLMLSLVGLALVSFVLVGVMVPDLFGYWLLRNIVGLYLPYDAEYRLYLNMRIRESRWTPPPSDLTWMSRRAAYPVNWREDVGFIMKSGFGTQHRIPAWLEAVRELGDVVLIADFATKPGAHYVYAKDGRQIPVHDVVGTMLEQRVFSGAELASSPRLEKYRNMSAAIARGDANAAKEISKQFGWELDAMKARTLVTRSGPVPDR